MHYFDESLRASQKPELLAQLDKAYLKFFPEHTVIDLKRAGVGAPKCGPDVIVRLRATQRKEEIQTIEEKIRSPKRSNYPDILLEYISNKEKGTLGSGLTSPADWFSHVTEPDAGVVVVEFLPMQPIKQWLYCNADRYPQIEALNLMRNGDGYYTTISIAVPRNVLLPSFMSYARFIIMLDGEVQGKVERYAA